MDLVYPSSWNEWECFWYYGVSTILSLGTELTVTWHLEASAVMLLMESSPLIHSQKSSLSANLSRLESMSAFCLQSHIWFLFPPRLMEHHMEIDKCILNLYRSRMANITQSIVTRWAYGYGKICFKMYMIGLKCLHLWSKGLFIWGYVSSIVLSLYIHTWYGQFWV